MRIQLPNRRMLIRPAETSAPRFRIPEERPWQIQICSSPLQNLGLRRFSSFCGRSTPLRQKPFCRFLTNRGPNGLGTFQAMNAFGLPAIPICKLLGLSPLAFLTMHSPVHFGLEDIRVSEEIGNLGPHPALKLWSKEVRTPTLGNADLPPLAGAFVTVDALAEVAYQTPAVFGAEHHSPKPVGALGVSGGIGEVRQPIGRQAVEKNT